MNGQLWSISTTTLQVRLRVQLNSILFAKTLVRKDLASTGSNSPTEGKKDGTAPEGDVEKKDDDFSSKSQIMTLMTTDVDRVSDFSWHFFSLVGEFVFYSRESLGTQNHLQMPPLSSWLERSSCTICLASPVCSDCSLRACSSP